MHVVEGCFKISPCENIVSTGRVFDQYVEKNNCLRTKKNLKEGKLHQMPKMTIEPRKVTIEAFAIM